MHCSLFAENHKYTTLYTGNSHDMMSKLKGDKHGVYTSVELLIARESTAQSPATGLGEPTPG